MIIIIYVKTLTNMTDETGGNPKKKRGSDCNPNRAGHAADGSLPPEAD